MLFISFGAFAQISVNSSGDVTICNKVNFTNLSSTQLNILPVSGINCYIGNPYFPFYHINSTYFYSGTNYIASDKRIKENFRNIEGPLSTILKMDGWKYDLKPNKQDSIGNEEEKQEKIKMKKDHLGFIAQELKEILPEAVYYDEQRDKYYIEYTSIIPVIVEAMKEQQATIDNLTSRIEKLEGSVTKEKSAPLGDATQASLNQNVPNPFTAITTINMYLPNTVTRAVLYIYNMQGKQIQNLTVQERGNTAITLEGHSLEAGMYLYTLIADGKEVDTHKMILTK